MDKIKVIIPSWSYWKNPLKLQPLWELHYATWLRKNFSNFKIIVEDLRDKEKNFIPTELIFISSANEGSRFSRGIFYM